jgi:hypothetical protein
MDTLSLKNKYMSLVNTMKRSLVIKREHRSSSMDSRKLYMKKVSRSDDFDEFKNKLIYLSKNKSLEVDLRKELDDPMNYPIHSDIAKIINIKEEIKKLKKEFDELKGLYIC